MHEGGLENEMCVRNAFVSKIFLWIAKVHFGPGQKVASGFIKLKMHVGWWIGHSAFLSHF
jgi:hypothetical protein